MSKSCKSLYFHTFMRFSPNGVFVETFLSTLSTFLKTLDFTGFVGNFVLLFFHSCAIIWDGLMDRIFHPALHERKEHNGKYNTS